MRRLAATGLLVSARLIRLCPEPKVAGPLLTITNWHSAVKRALVEIRRFIFDVVKDHQAPGFNLNKVEFGACTPPPATSLRYISAEHADHFLFEDDLRFSNPSHQNEIDIPGWRMNHLH